MGCSISYTEQDPGTSLWCFRDRQYSTLTTPPRDEVAHPANACLYSEGSSMGGTSTLVSSTDPSSHSPRGSPPQAFSKGDFPSLGMVPGSDEGGGGGEPPTCYSSNQRDRICRWTCNDHKPVLSWDTSLTTSGIHDLTAINDEPAKMNTSLNDHLPYHCRADLSNSDVPENSSNRSLQNLSDLLCDPQTGILSKTSSSQCLNTIKMTSNHLCNSSHVNAMNKNQMSSKTFNGRNVKVSSDICHINEEDRTNCKFTNDLYPISHCSIVKQPSSHSLKTAKTDLRSGHHSPISVVSDSDSHVSCSCSLQRLSVMQPNCSSTLKKTNDVCSSQPNITINSNERSSKSHCDKPNICCRKINTESGEITPPVGVLSTSTGDSPCNNISARQDNAIDNNEKARRVSPLNERSQKYYLSLKKRAQRATRTLTQSNLEGLSIFTCERLSALTSKSNASKSQSERHLTRTSFNSQNNCTVITTSNNPQCFSVIADDLTPLVNTTSNNPHLTDSPYISPAHSSNSNSPPTSAKCSMTTINCSGNRSTNDACKASSN